MLRIKAGKGMPAFFIESNGRAEVAVPAGLMKYLWMRIVSVEYCILCIVVSYNIVLFSHRMPTTARDPS